MRSKTFVASRDHMMNFSEKENLDSYEKNIFRERIKVRKEFNHFLNSTNFTKQRKIKFKEISDSLIIKREKMEENIRKLNEVLNKKKNNELKLSEEIKKISEKKNRFLKKIENAKKKIYSEKLVFDILMNKNKILKNDWFVLFKSIIQIYSEEPLHENNLNKIKEENNLVQLKKFIVYKNLFKIQEKYEKVKLHRDSLIEDKKNEFEKNKNVRNNLLDTYVTFKNNLQKFEMEFEKKKKVLGELEKKKDLLIEKKQILFQREDIFQIIKKLLENENLRFLDFLRGNQICKFLRKFNFYRDQTQNIESDVNFEIPKTKIKLNILDSDFRGKKKSEFKNKQKIGFIGNEKNEKFKPVQNINNGFSKKMSDLNFKKKDDNLKKTSEFIKKTKTKKKKIQHTLKDQSGEKTETNLEKMKKMENSIVLKKLKKLNPLVLIKLLLKFFLKFQKSINKNFDTMKIMEAKKLSQKMVLKEKTDFYFEKIVPSKSIKRNNLEKDKNTSKNITLNFLLINLNFIMNNSIFISVFLSKINKVFNQIKKIKTNLNINPISCNKILELFEKNKIKNFNNNNLKIDSEFEEFFIGSCFFDNVENLYFLFNQIFKEIIIIKKNFKIVHKIQQGQGSPQSRKHKSINKLKTTAFLPNLNNNELNNRLSIGNLRKMKISIVKQPKKKNPQEKEVSKNLSGKKSMFFQKLSHAQFSKKNLNHINKIKIFSKIHYLLKENKPKKKKMVIIRKKTLPENTSNYEVSEAFEKNRNMIIKLMMKERKSENDLKKHTNLKKIDPKFTRSLVPLTEVAKSSVIKTKKEIENLQKINLKLNKKSLGKILLSKNPFSTVSCKFLTNFDNILNPHFTFDIIRDKN